MNIQQQSSPVPGKEASPRQLVEFVGDVSKKVAQVFNRLIFAINQVRTET